MMNRRDFIRDYTPVIVRIHNRPTCIGYSRGDTFRSVVRYSTQVLHRREGRPPAIAKEKWIYNNIIRPTHWIWEVFDEERQLILKTTVQNFDEHYENWKAGSYEQFLLEEPFWEITKVGETQPAQGKLI
jgi:hypothetical protein